MGLNGGCGAEIKGIIIKGNCGEYDFKRKTYSYCGKCYLKYKDTKKAKSITGIEAQGKFKKLKN